MALDFKYYNKKAEDEDKKKGISPSSKTTSNDDGKIDFAHYNRLAAEKDEKSGYNARVRASRENAVKDAENDNNDSRLGSFFKGTAKQLAGSNLSSVGTTLQSVNPIDVTKTLMQPGGFAKYVAGEIGDRITEGITGKEKEKSGTDKVFNAIGRNLTSKADQMLESGASDIEKSKEGLGTLGKFGVDVASQGLLMGSDALINAIAPGAGMSAFYSRAAGYGANEARRAGATENQQLLYGAMAGLTELGLEKVFSAGKYLKGIYGKGAIDLAEPIASKVATSKLVRGIAKSKQGQELIYQLTKMGVAANEEGIEEALSDIISPFLKRAVYSDEIEMPRADEVLYDYLLGAASGGLFGAAGTVADYRSGVGRMNQMENEATQNGTDVAGEAISRAQVQADKSDAKTFADQLQRQMESGADILGGQVNDLARMTRSQQIKNESELMKQKQQADKEFYAGDVSKITGDGSVTYYRAVADVASNLAKDESSFLQEIIDESPDLYVGMSGDSTTIGAIAKVVVGTATTEDIDRILMKPSAKELLSDRTGMDIPVANTEARKTIESLVSISGATNRADIRKQAKVKLAEDLSQSLGTEGSKTFVSLYQNVADVDNEKFNVIFDRYYNAGTYNIGVADMDKIVSGMSEPYVVVAEKYFTPEVKSAVMKAGFADSRAETMRNEQSVIRRKKPSETSKKGVLRDEPSGKLSAPMKTALEAFAHRTGVNVVFTDTLSGGKANGAYATKSEGAYINGTIYLAADSANPLITVAKHELTHHLKKFAPAEYQELEDFVFAEWYNRDKEAHDKAIRDKIDEYEREGYKLTMAEAKEEILADAAESFFRDEAAIDSAIEHSKKLGEAILDGIRSILDTFMAIRDGDSNRRDKGYGKFLDEIGILEEAQHKWMKALQASTMNDVKSDDGKTKASIKQFEFSKAQALENMRTVAKMKPLANLKQMEFPGEGKVSEKVKKYYEQIGSVYNDVIGTVIVDSEKGIGQAWAHKGNVAKVPAYKAVPEIIQNGKIIDAQRNWKGKTYDTVVIAAPINVENVPYYMAVVVKRVYTNNFQRYYLHDVIAIEKKQSASGHAVERTRVSETASLLRLLQQLNDVNSLTEKDIVSHEGKFSLKDSDGRQLSDAQQQFFKDSKVRDEDGNLRVVYHGSAENFTVFDRTKGRSNMDIQGMFFSPWEVDAMGYGENVQAYYLNIKNPAPESLGYKALRKFQGQNNAGVKARDYLESLGYDGVNNGDEEYIAFHSNQIKLTSNQNPTKSDDIRYSLKDAALTDERIDYIIKDQGASGNYARSYVAHISPRDFLKLTLSDGRLNDWQNAVGKVDELYKLDEEKLRGNKQTPYLSIDSATGTVIGHEGRHRMLALMNSGIENVSILVEDLATKYSKEPMPEMKLSSQDFGNGPVNNGATAFVRDLYPTNDKYREDIRRVHGTGNGLRYSFKVEEDADVEKIGTYIENGTIKYQFNGELQAAPRSVVDYKGVKDELGKKEISLRDLRNNWLNKNGMQNQVAPLNSMMDQLMKYIEEDALQRYKYVGLADVVDAKIKYRVDKNGRPSSVVISAMVKNAEYPINFDFTSVCKKRLAMQRVIEQLVSENGENDVLYNEFDLSAGQVHEINKVLASYGFETACPICFVEARRYYNQAYADKAISIWNGILEKYEPNAEYFNLAEADSDFFDYDEIREAFNAFDITKKGARSYPDKVDALFRAHPYFRKKLKVSDLLSTKGIETMRALKKEGADDLGLLGIIKGSRGASVAKEVTAFTAYNGEIGMLSENVGNQKRTMRDYLFEIGGARMQSFSDFLIANVFDYIQLIGDLAARKFPAHAYTKEIIFAKLFGLTGMKINLSAVCDVDPNVPDEYAGLKQNEYGEWEYNIGEQSINMDDAIELVNTEGYSRNVSIIMVGMSDEHIWKMLDDKNIGYIIPYHKSNLPEVIGATSHLSKARDYTDYQGTMILKGIKDGDRVIEYDFAAKHEELGSWRAVMEEFNAEVKANGWTVETNKIGDGTGDFDTYEALTRMSPAEVADAYIGDCLTNGKMPIFYEFAGHENYYKMGCFDYGVVDLVTGETTIQGEVKNIYPGIDITKGETDASELIKMIDQEMSRMDSFNKVQEGKYADAIAEIKKNLSQHMRDAETAEMKRQLKDDDSYTERKIAKLEDKVAKLRSEFKRTYLKTPKDVDVNRQATRLIKRYDSNLTLHPKLVNAMRDIFRIYKTKDGSWGEAYSIAEDAARQIVDKITVLHDESWREYKDLRTHLKNAPVRVSEADRASMTDYSAFRKANFGRIKLTNDQGLSVDQYYQGLVEQWPDKFTDDYVTASDQLYHIADVLDSLAPWYETYDSAEMQDFVTDIAADIMETAYNLQTRKTFADRKAEEKAAAVARVKAQREAAMDKLQERYEQKLIRQKKVSREKMDAYKEKQKDRASRKKAMERLQKSYKWLNERLLNPSDTKHIPESYRKVIAELLSGFDFETDRSAAYAEKNGPSKKTIQFMKFMNDYSEIMKSEEGQLIEFDPDIIDTMNEIKNAVDGKRLADLDTETLDKVSRLLKTIQHQMSYVNRCFSEDISKTISELGEDAINGTRAMKKSKEYAGMRKHFDDLLNQLNVTPSDMFELIGGPMKTLYQQLRKGMDRHIINLKVAKDYVDKVVDGKKMDEWSNEVHKIQTSDGTLEITTSQIMSLYALMQRKQAQGHILGSGIVMAPVEVKAGKGRKSRSTRKMEETKIIPELEDITEIISRLTDEQIEVADQLRSFLGNECSEWGNRTSMKLYGYKKFTEKDYFPINSSDYYLYENYDAENGESSLKNMGFTKGIVKEANNPIIIDDIFDVFANHVSKMSMYEALVPAMTDFMRVYNYKTKNTEGKQNNSVKKALSQAFGRKTTEYIKRFIKDINGQAAKNDSTIATSLMALYKKASIGGNSRVLLQQPTAIVRAMAVMNPKYLLSVKPATKADVAEMQAHCPIAQWKSWGFYNTDAARDFRDILFGKENLVDKAFMGTYGKADDFTWACIWKAVKKEVEEKNPDLEKGSDEYWQKVNERASYVYDRTQVVDSVFHRSQIMRNKGTLEKMATSFMAEPTKTYNMMRTEIILARREKAAGQRTAAAERMGRVLSVYLLNAITVSMAAAVADAMIGAGGDDDEDKGNFLQRWLAHTKANFVDNVNPLNLVPYVKDVVSLYSGYDVPRMDMQAFSKLMQVNSMWEGIANRSSKYSTAHVVRKTAEAISYFTGLPVRNLLRDAEGLAKSIAEAFGGGTEMRYLSAKMMYTLGPDSGNRTIFADLYYDALADGNTELANEIRGYMTSKGVDSDYINRRKKKWEENRKS